MIFRTLKYDVSLGLRVVLESLGSSLRSVLRRIAGASHVDENLIKEVVRDIQRALLQADVNVNLTLNITKGVQRRATDEKPPAGMSPREHVIRIIYEELVKVLGKPKDIALGRQRILFVGLYGQGKTTSIAKLARFFQKRGLSVALVACDTHRPAAYDQLRQLGDSISVPVLGGPQEKDARKVAMQGVKDFDNMDVAIFDSSGRHSLEADLIQEIKDLAAIIKPDEIILAMDATTGQQAGPQAKAFHEAVGVTSVILTKLDGSAKGGGALSAVAETKAPIVFVGVGEKIEDFEKFDPPRFISRLLGMGDLQSLLEKAQEAMDQEKAEETAKKILSGRFTLREMYDQMEMLTKMGSLRKIFSMLPGIPGKMSDEDLDATQERLRVFRIIMDSMTDAELDNPRDIKSTHIMRIARGSGTSPKQVKELLKQYNMARKAVKGFASDRRMRRQLLKQMKAGGLDVGE